MMFVSTVQLLGEKRAIESQVLTLRRDRERSRDLGGGLKRQVREEHRRRPALIPMLGKPKLSPTWAKRSMADNRTSTFGKPSPVRRSAER